MCLLPFFSPSPIRSLGHHATYLKRVMLKPLRQLVSFKEPAAEPAVEEASQAMKGWKDFGVMLWLRLG
jgi:hypothetical protein